MKNLIFLVLLCFTTMALAQINKPVIIKRLPIENKNIIANKTEAYQINLSQPPVLHSDGGWEKGPSPWVDSKNYPFKYRGGLLLLNRKGMVCYLMTEFLFRENGSIEVSANSMEGSPIGLHPFKRIYGKVGQITKLTVITKEKEFGAQMIIYVKEYKPFKQSQVN